MRGRLFVWSAALTLGLAAVPVSAHHSFAAEFDQNQVVTLMGTVTQMEWVNPHAMIHLAVKNSDGTVTDWRIEGNTPNSLLRAGLTKKTLEPGTELVVRGYRARSGDNIVSGSAILLKDGRKLALGSREGAGAAPLLDWVASDEQLWVRQLALWAQNQTSDVADKNKPSGAASSASPASAPGGVR